MPLVLLLLMVESLMAQGGRYVLHRNFPSQFVDPRTIVVYLPPDYDLSTNRYPVLYMHDGQNLFDNQKTGLRGAGSPIKWNVDVALENLLREGEISPCIIVGIFNTAKRIEEYSPPTNAPGGGLLSNYGRFIVEELKPWIDSHYRTDPSVLATGIMGSSMGGLASFYLQMWYPNIFGFAGVVSPSFWWGNEQVLTHLERFDLNAPRRLYIDAGWKESDEMMTPARHMYQKLAPIMGERLWYYEDRQGTHSESSWQSRVFIPLRLFLGKTPPRMVAWDGIIDPPVIGIQDTSSVTVEVTYTGGLKRTILPTLSSPQLAISGLFITGQVAGNASLTIHTPYGDRITNLTIQGKSRDDITIRFVSSQPLILEVFRYVTNNIAVATNLEINLITQREIPLTQRRGTRLYFHLLDENRRPLERNGKPIELSVTFTRDRDYEVTF